jgi:hypothetical protein
LNNLQFTGDDFFADKDVCSIVLEVPNTVLGRKRIGLWARTLKDEGGVWVQADRGGLPAQAVFLVGGGDRDAYLAGEPAEDARFVGVFAHALEHAGGYKPEEARRVAGTLLPDVLSYDPTRPASFPINGRTLTDDVAGCPHKRKGDRGQGRASRRSACRVPLLGAAAQCLRSSGIPHKQIQRPHGKAHMVDSQSHYRSHFASPDSCRSWVSIPQRRSALSGPLAPFMEIIFSSFSSNQTATPFP